MTHVKNAEAFARIVDFCTGYGGSYNPGRQTLRIESLLTQKQAMSNALNRVISAKSFYDNEVNLRRQTFDQLPRLASSVMRTLEASGASPEKLDDARAYAREISGSAGKSRPPIPAADGQAVVTPHSRALQLAFASMAEWFARLVDTVTAEPLYLSNEAHLSKAGLAEKVNQLNTLNQQVSAARVAWSNALIDRNHTMYHQRESLLNTTKAVKKYVRAIFGHNSGQYAQIKSLRFTKPELT